MYLSWVHRTLTWVYLCMCLGLGVRYTYYSSGEMQVVYTQNKWNPLGSIHLGTYAAQDVGKKEKCQWFLSTKKLTLSPLNSANKRLASCNSTSRSRKRPQRQGSVYSHGRYKTDPTWRLKMSFFHWKVFARGFVKTGEFLLVVDCAALSTPSANTGMPKTSQQLN